MVERAQPWRWASPGSHIGAGVMYCRIPASTSRPSAQRWFAWAAALDQGQAVGSLSIPAPTFRAQTGSPGRQRANKRRRKVVWLSPGVLLDFAFYLFARERDGGERFENGIGFVLRLFDSFLDGPLLPPAPGLFSDFLQSRDSARRQRAVLARFGRVWHGLYGFFASSRAGLPSTAASLAWAVKSFGVVLGVCC